VRALKTTVVTASGEDRNTKALVERRQLFGAAEGGVTRPSGRPLAKKGRELADRSILIS